MENRTYLWLFLTFDIITGSRGKYRKFSTIDSLLSEMPTEIADAYEKILERSSDKDHARRLFNIVIAARRPLTLPEANVALSIATTTTACTHFEALDLRPDETFESTIKDICGLFVSVHDGKLFLIHQTAKDFLLRVTPTQYVCHNRFLGSVDVALAESQMSTICVTFLSFAEFFHSENLAAGDTMTGKYAQFFGPGWFFDDGDNWLTFFEYAAYYWHNHYIAQPLACAKHAAKAVKQLCSPDANWTWRYGALLKKDAQEPKDGFPHDSGLAIACFLGLESVAERFLDEETQVLAAAHPHNAGSLSDDNKVMAKQGLQNGGSGKGSARKSYISALLAASGEGHVGLVTVLMDRGADIEAQSDDGETALIRASKHGRYDVVKLLLDKGANINGPGTHQENALYTASCSGQSQIVELLLDEGADVNSRAPDGNSALQVVAESDEETSTEIMQLLLGRGADVHAQGGFLGNALLAAVFIGSIEKVHLLLESIAHVNAKSHDGEDALQVAVYSSYTTDSTILQLLLDHGADEHAQGPPWGNALQAAVEIGSIEKVRLLLDSGADVNANAKNRYGEDALQLALEPRADIEIMQLLFDRGANIHFQGGQWGNVLIAGVSHGYIEKVQFLLDNGADINVEGPQGNALDVAVADKDLSYFKETQQAMIQMLIERGATLSGGRRFEWSMVR